MMKKCVAPLIILLLCTLILSGCGSKSESDAVVLRVSNWEEYIDLGDWDEEEAIELEDGTVILGCDSLIDEFEEWYYEEYGQRVEVEYSTFGTNEEMYNQITIGDVYDLVCPSEYMIMKMLREGMLIPYSEDFYDTEIDDNYYALCVSPYIKGVFDELDIEGNILSDYAAGYMWGTLGIVYNPEVISREDAAHWDIVTDRNYYKQVNVKDSVRDAYFGAICQLYYDEITDPDFLAREDYHEALSEILNRTDEQTVAGVEEVLSRAKDNAYAFETDAGKADMVAGKVFACEQWSGDAVYSMDQADEDGLRLCYSAPDEGTNLWFDGWVMLKDGIEQDARKQQAAEAFVNFLSRPENAIRNMYYIGYTSAISGGKSSLIFDYINWNYGAAEDEEETFDYSIGYFFEDDSKEANDKYTITAPLEQQDRQLTTQYPAKEVVDRSVVMACFEDEGNVRINRMWTNVRCFDLKSLFD